MEKFFLVCVFAFSLFLKVSNAAGAEVENSGQLLASSADVQSSAQGGDAENQVQEKTTIQNNVNVSQPPMYVQGNPNSDAAAVLGTSQRYQSTQNVSIAPMVGGTFYNGRWYDHVHNSYTFGLLLDIPVNERLSVEVEGTYGRYNVQYSYYGHDFNQYGIGANGKLYLSRGILQPYVGAGMMALRYENMSYGPAFPYARYDQWIGAPQAIAGLDAEIFKNTAVGIRGQWVLPLINRPGVADNGYYAYPYYEDASLMNTTFIRVMGTVRLMF